MFKLSDFYNPRKLRKRSTTFVQKSRVESECSRARKVVEVAALVLFKFWVIMFWAWVMFSIQLGCKPNSLFSIYLAVA